MPYAAAGLHLVIAIFFATHALRTGRPWYWVMILLSFPLLGSLFYFVTEYLPEMRYSRGGRKVLRAVEAAVDPNRALREAETDFERSPTAANRAALAAALLEPVLKERLKTECATALVKGVFGSPHIIIDGEHFFGADRLPQIERWLASGSF